MSSIYIRLNIIEYTVHDDDCNLVAPEAYPGYFSLFQQVNQSQNNIIYII